MGLEKFNASGHAYFYDFADAPFKKTRNTERTRLSWMAALADPANFNRQIGRYVWFSRAAVASMNDTVIVAAKKNAQSFCWTDAESTFFGFSLYKGSDHMISTEALSDVAFVAASRANGIVIRKEIIDAPELSAEVRSDVLRAKRAERIANDAGVAAVISLTAMGGMVVTVGAFAVLASMTGPADAGVLQTVLKTTAALGAVSAGVSVVATGMKKMFSLEAYKACAHQMKAAMPLVFGKPKKFLDQATSPKNG